MAYLTVTTQADVVNPGDGPASEFYLDGKTMVAFAPAENLATQLVIDMAVPFMLKGQEFQSGVSIGIAVTQSVQQADTLIAEADRALYAAKAAGRNTWRRADAH